jgi:lycopene beta-cyclase
LWFFVSFVFHAMTFNTNFDFILAGGGAAGLSLACHLVRSPLRDASILIIDKDDEDQMRRNWGYWSRRPNFFDPTPDHTWRTLRFEADGVRHDLDLGEYSYTLVRGRDFYRFAKADLAAHPNVTFVQDVVDEICDGEEAATVTAGGTTYRGSWVFDSLLSKSDLKRIPPQYHQLKMHFKGWEIETPAPAFDTSAATLFDFRTPQRGLMRFFYVMPYAPNRALVEYTIFSEHVLPKEAYEAALREHIEGVRGIHDYKIIEEENGAVPITNYPFPRKEGRRIMAIGAKAGRVKPSTGYSIMRVQRDTENIVQSLVQHGHPFDVPEDSEWYRLLDRVMLEIMQEAGETLAPIFTAMFTRNPAERILHFLDEQASAVEQAALIASLPAGEFVKALGRVMMQKEQV